MISSGFSILVALNKGLLGFPARNATGPEHPSLFKVLPVVRHFVAYAGPDGGRFSFDAGLIAALSPDRKVGPTPEGVALESFAEGLQPAYVPADSAARFPN